MITFKAIVISNNRRKDGTYPVKIRVTFKGVSRRLPTTLVARPADLTRSLKIKSSEILNKTDDLICDMRDAVKDISPFDLEAWDVDQVVAHIKHILTRDNFRLDFFEWADTFLSGKTESTRKQYVSAVNYLALFLGKRQIDINAISRPMLLDFMEFVEESPKMIYNHFTGELVQSSASKMPKGASTRYILKLGHIYNAARDRYNDEDSGRILIPRNPFGKIDKRLPLSSGQKNLGVETMQRIISAQTDNPAMRTALDVFIVSFGLMGANMADLYAAKPFTGEVWVYNRQKTASRRADKAEMRVRLPEVLEPFLTRLQGAGKGWWLNTLHGYASSCIPCTARVNRYLKKWCEENGIATFTFYSGRHSFASIGRGVARIEKATIDECLCHKGDFSLTDIYAERSWELLWEANEKVLSLFTW